MTSFGLEIVNTDGAVVSLIVSGSYARSISERWDRPAIDYKTNLLTSPSSLCFVGTTPGLLLMS